jgi:hypothetical protein
MLELFKDFELILFTEQAIRNMPIDNNRNELPELLFLNYFI